MQPDHQLWQVRDFVWAMLGGLAGAIALGAGALAAGTGEDGLIVFGSLGQFAGHLLTIGLMARRRGGLRSLGFEVEPSDVVYIFYGVGLQIVLPLIFGPLAQLFSDGSSGQAVADQIRQLQTAPYRFLMAGVVAVLAPIAEELMFRGILLRATAAGGMLRATLWTSAVFAAFHLFGLSGDLLASLVLLVPTFLIMGVVLARMTLRRGRIGPAIFVHSGFNLLALSVLLLPPELLETLSTTP